MKTTNAILQAARARLASGWTQHTEARDIFGRPVSPLDKRAVCWCPIGAIKACAKPEIDLDWGAHFQHPALFALSEQMRDEFRQVMKERPLPVHLYLDLPVVSAFNDLNRMTQATVLEMFDRAIYATEIRPL